MIISRAGRFVRKVKSKLSPEKSTYEEDSFLRRLELGNVIKIYFDFMYYLGASPFRFVKDVGSGYYYIKTWRLQQILCAIMHILCIFRLISQIRESIPVFSRLKKNPTPYFHFILGICSLFYKMSTMKGFWWAKEHYLKVVNFALAHKHLPVRNKTVTKPYFIYSLFGFSTLQVVACLIIGYNFVIPMWDWSPSWWLRRLVAQARFVLCFENKMERNTAPELSDITILDGFLAFLTAVALISRWTVGPFCDHCILAASLTLWTTASAFAGNIEAMLQIDEEWDKQVQNGNLSQIMTSVCSEKQRQPKYLNQKQPWTLIYKNFQAIKNHSEEINLALGNQVTWYLAEGLMYYSINLNYIFVTKDPFNRFYGIVFIVITILILWVSGDICTKLEMAKTWLVKNNNIRTVPVDEANLVLLEMTAKDIGIRGSNIFTITFSLITGFLSLLATFFIICVQQSEDEQ